MPEISSAFSAANANRGVRQHLEPSGVNGFTTDFTLITLAVLNALKSCLYLAQLDPRFFFQRINDFIVLSLLSLLFRVFVQSAVFTLLMCLIAFQPRSKIGSQCFKFRFAIAHITSPGIFQTGVGSL
jgi:hypothetical protein